MASTEHERLVNINLAYRLRFSFPLIIALRMHQTLESVFLEAERRLGHDKTTEMEIAINQVSLVIEGRLERLLKT